MRTVILSALTTIPGAGIRLGARLEAELAGRGWPVDVVDVTRVRVLHCRGCSGCSEKTPGLCVLKDDMRDILPRIVNSDCLVLATPIVFGTHHPALKQVIDRFLPLLSPVWVSRRKELHGRMRYLRRPALLGVGVPTGDGPGDGDAFARLLDRHAVNLDAPRHAVTVILASADDAAFAVALHPALDRLEGRA